MSMTYKFTDTGARKKFRDLEKIPPEVLKEGYQVFLAQTPVRSGNARRSTKLDTNRNEIQAKYAYAQRLDTGWSKQSPQGMSKAAEAAMIKAFETLSRKAGD